MDTPGNVPPKQSAHPDVGRVEGSTVPNIGNNTSQVKTIYTSIPEEWHNKVLFDWGSKGLRVEGNQRIGRAKTFNPLWLDQVKRIKRGENPALIRELRKMTQEIWEVRSRSGKYWNTDHYLASPDAIAEAQARINTRKLTRLEKQIQAAETKLETKRDRLIEVQQFNANSKNYFTRRFLTEQVKSRPAEFIAWAKRSWQRDRNIITDIETGKRIRIEPKDRLILDNLREQLDIPESIRTEGDLAKDPQLFERYQRNVDDYFQKTAEETHKRITDPLNGHGVEQASSDEASPLLKRRLTLDESDPAAELFLDRNAENIMAAYHHTVGGMIATRLAIARNKHLMPKDVEITTAQDHLKWIDDRYKELIQTTQKLDNVSGTELTAALQDDHDKAMKRLWRRVDNLEGRHLIDPSDGANAMFKWAGQQIMNLNYVAMLGSQSLLAVNDLATLVLFSDITSVPQNVKYMVKAIAPLKEASKRELQMLGLAFEGEQARSLAMFDVDFEDSKLGFGQGKIRRITSGISDFNNRLNPAFNEISLINSWNRYAKRGAAHIAMNRLTTHSRKMIKAQALMDSGIEQGQALRKAGISRFDFAQMKELGIDVPAARQWLKADGDAARPIFDTYVAAINTQVNRMMVVTPELMDKPLMNDSWWGRALNQFSTFGFAWANQVARPMAQRPGGKVIAGIGTYLAVGAMIDAIRNHLSGRRDFDQTMKMWADNPLGMTYTVTQTSGLTGWFMRPMAVLDKMGVGLGSAVGADGATTSRAAYRANSFLGSISPVVDTIERNYQGVSGILSGGYDDVRKWHMLRKSLPRQNLIEFRILTKYTGLDPYLTERMMQKRREQYKKRAN